MTERPTLTVTAAVAAFEVERRTLQRMLAADQLPGTSKDNRGRWTIPVEALHAAGFAARKTWISDATAHDSDATKSTTQRDNDATATRQTASNQRSIDATNDATNDATERDNDATDLRQHVARLEAQLDAEKRLREAAERNAEDLRNAMRMLEVGQPQPAAQEPAAAPSRRRWWQRS